MSYSYDYVKAQKDAADARAAAEATRASQNAVWRAHGMPERPTPFYGSDLSSAPEDFGVKLDLKAAEDAAAAAAQIEADAKAAREKVKKASTCTSYDTEEDRNKAIKEAQEDADKYDGVPSDKDDDSCCIM